MPNWRTFGTYDAALRYVVRLYDITGVIAGITRNGQTWKVG